MFEKNIKKWFFNQLHSEVEFSSSWGSQTIDKGTAIHRYCSKKNILKIFPKFIGKLVSKFPLIKLRT